jgi:hypothetical protein
MLDVMTSASQSRLRRTWPGWPEQSSITGLSQPSGVVAVRRRGRRALIFRRARPGLVQSMPRGGTRSVDGAQLSVDCVWFTCCPEICSLYMLCIKPVSMYSTDLDYLEN